MNPYKVLGVSENASQEEIRAAYLELVKKYHPDKYADNPASMGCETNRNEMPPSRASAEASFSPETDCITADTSGMLILNGLGSPTRCLQIGVFNETFCGEQSDEE